MSRWCLTGYSSGFLHQPQSSVRQESSCRHQRFTTIAFPLTYDCPRSLPPLPSHTSLRASEKQLFNFVILHVQRMLTYTYMRLYTYTTYIYIHTYMCVCIYIYIHTHTHTQCITQHVRTNTKCVHVDQGLYKEYPYTINHFDSIYKLYRKSVSVN